MSAAPPTAKNASAAHKTSPVRPPATPLNSPNPTIASPHTTIAATTTSPWRRTRGSQPENTPPATAPAEIAAASSAIVVPPSTGPPKLSWAICGNSARGIPKTIAIRSTTNDINTTVLPARYLNPSQTDLNPSDELWPVGGIGLNRIVAQIGAKQVITSIRYSVDRSTQRNMTPASSGPTIAPNCVTVMFSELAAGSWSPGSIRGIAAERVGALMA